MASVLISKPDIVARACQAMAARVGRTTSASGTFEKSREVTAVILGLHLSGKPVKLTIMTDDQLATDVNAVSRRPPRPNAHARTRRKDLNHALAFALNEGRT
jgi:hypothetical protein